MGSNINGFDFGKLIANFGGSSTKTSKDQNLLSWMNVSRENIIDMAKKAQAISEGLQTISTKMQKSGDFLNNGGGSCTTGQCQPKAGSSKPRTVCQTTTCKKTYTPTIKKSTKSCSDGASCSRTARNDCCPKPKKSTRSCKDSGKCTDGKCKPKPRKKTTTQSRGGCCKTRASCSSC